MQNSDLWYTEFNSFDVQKRTYGISFKFEKQLVHDQSEYQKIDIIETCSFGKMLILDGCVMLTERDEFVYHEMISFVPCSLLEYFGKKPKKALVIGGGDGGTVRELLKVDSIESVDLCEIDGKVVDYCREYFPGIAGMLGDPRVNVHIGDGVEFVKGKENMYDVICIDSTDPVGPAEGLFNSSFYQNVMNALTPEGVVTAQEESYFYHEDFLRQVSEKLNRIYPFVEFYRADIPTYPSGTWCFVLASKVFDPLVCRNMDWEEKVVRKGKYYNARMHRGAFSMPTYIEEFLKEKR